LDYNVGVAIKGRTFETSLRTYHKLSQVQLAVFSRATERASFATTFDYQLDKNAQVRGVERVVVVVVVVVVEEDKNAQVRGGWW